MVAVALAADPEQSFPLVRPLACSFTLSLTRTHPRTFSDFVAPGRATRARASTKKQEVTLEFEEIRGPWPTKEGKDHQGQGKEKQKDRAA